LKEFEEHKTWSEHALQEMKLRKIEGMSFCPLPNPRSIQQELIPFLKFMMLFGPVKLGMQDLDLP
jgi:hypothetical protein